MEQDDAACVLRVVSDASAAHKAVRGPAVATPAVDRLRCLLRTPRCSATPRATAPWVARPKAQPPARRGAPAPQARGGGGDAQEDADLVLARALQEQENAAFMLMQQQAGHYGYGDDRCKGAA
jgi:hypothetical protein